MAKSRKKREEPQIVGREAEPLPAPPVGEPPNEDPTPPTTEEQATQVAANVAVAIERDIVKGAERKLRKKFGHHMRLAEGEEPPQPPAVGADQEEQPAPKFWDLCMAAGTTAWAKSGNFRLYVSRLDPVCGENGEEIPLDNILVLNLPKDQDAVARIIRGRHGGGTYCFSIMDQRTNEVVAMSEPDDRVTINDTPPKFPTISAVAAHDTVRESKMSLEVTRNRVEETKLKKELREIEEGAKGKGDDDLRTEIQRLKQDLERKTAEDRHQQELRQMEARHQEQMAQLRALVESQKQPATGGNSELLNMMLKSQADTNQVLMKAILEGKTKGEGNELLHKLAEMGMEGLRGGGGEPPEPGDETAGMLKAMLPAVISILTPKAQQEQAQQMTPQQIEAMTLEAAQRLLPHPPQLPPPAGQAAPQPQGDPVIKQIAQQILTDMGGDLNKYPAPWAQMLFNATTPEQRVQFANASAVDLFALLSREAPAEAGKLAVTLSIRPAIKKWMENNQAWFKKQTLGAGASTPTNPAQGG